MSVYMKQSGAKRLERPDFMEKCTVLSSRNEQNSKPKHVSQEEQYMYYVHIVILFGTFLLYYIICEITENSWPALYEQSHSSNT